MDGVQIPGAGRGIYMSERPVEIILSGQRTPADELVDAFSRSTRSIDGVVYKFSERRIFKALVKILEANPDVKVRLVVDRKLVGENKRGKLVRKLLEHGGNVSIRKWSGHKLHAKFVVVDDRRAFAGSYNWTESSDRNTELLLEFTDSEGVNEFTRLFNDLWKDSTKV